MDGSGDAPTIQAGIDSAAAGDTVWAQPGYFRENLDFLGKAIVVRGSGMGVTTLDGYGQGSCVVFFGGEGRSSVLEDITIIGGSGSCFGSCGGRWGGGINIFNAEPTIRRNRIVDNDTGISSSSGGGGISCAAYESPFGTASPLIEDNLIDYNYSGGNGGGIAAEGTIAPVIVGNVIRNNESRFGDGGGIYARLYAGGIVIQGNRIEGNVADDHGGGMLLGLGTDVIPVVEMTVQENLIASNQAQGSGRAISSGGGIWVEKVSGSISKNTLVGNRGGGPDSTWGGGGIAISSSPEVVVELNIVAYSTYGGGIRCNGPAPALIRNNLGWQNVGGDGVGLCADWWQSDGNVVDNPYFCDPEGGVYTVAVNSPAMTHPAAPLGAFSLPGCGRVAVQSLTWGRLKSLYR